MNEISNDVKINKIPNDWKAIPIYELRNKEDRYSFTGGPFGSDLKSEHYTSSGVKIIQLQNIGEGRFINKGLAYTSEEKANELFSCNIYPEEIILAKMAPVARCCKVPSVDQRYVMSSDGIRLSVDKKCFNNEFVFQALNSKYFRDEAESKSTGTTRARIGLNDLKLIPIYVPNNIVEQQKIADILSTVDDKIEVIDQQITQTQEFKKGLMQRLLTKGIGHTEFKDSPLGKIPKSWEVVELVKHIKLLSGFAFKSDSFNEEGRGTKLLRGINITIGKLRWNNKLDRWWDLPFNDYEKYLAQVGDLVISMDGSLVGRNYARVKEEDLPILIVQRVACLRAEKTLNLEYLNQIIGSPLWLNYVDAVKTSSGIPHISAKNIRDFKIPFPSITEQQIIANILSTVDEKLEVLIEKKVNYQELKQGLMQQLLTGKIRVKV